MTRIVNVIVSVAHVVARAFHVLRMPHIHIGKWSQCFFHCSVVNGVQCVSIPDRTDATPAITKWLGGQKMAKRKKKAVKKKKKL